VASGQIVVFHVDQVLQDLFVLLGDQLREMRVVLEARQPELGDALDRLCVRLFLFNLGLRVSLCYQLAAKETFGSPSSSSSSSLSSRVASSSVGSYLPATISARCTSAASHINPPPYLSIDGLLQAMVLFSQLQELVLEFRL
jgi:hypothetical protein